MLYLNYLINRISFVDVACAGNEKCKAVAWHDNNKTIFLDDLIKGSTDANTRYDEMNCELHAKREREASSVERQYLNKIGGRFVAIYMNYLPCKIQTN